MGFSQNADCEIAEHQIYILLSEYLDVCEFSKCGVAHEKSSRSTSNDLI